MYDQPLSLGQNIGDGKLRGFAGNYCQCLGQQGVTVGRLLGDTHVHANRIGAPSSQTYAKHAAEGVVLPRLKERPQHRYIDARRAHGQQFGHRWAKCLDDGR